MFVSVSRFAPAAVRARKEADGRLWPPPHQTAPPFYAPPLRRLLRRREACLGIPSATRTRTRPAYVSVRSHTFASCLARTHARTHAEAHARTRRNVRQALAPRPGTFPWPYPSPLPVASPTISPQTLPRYIGLGGRSDSPLRLGGANRARRLRVYMRANTYTTNAVLQHIVARRWEAAPRCTPGRPSVHPRPLPAARAPSPCADDEHAPVVRHVVHKRRKPVRVCVGGVRRGGDRRRRARFVRGQARGLALPYQNTSQALPQGLRASDTPRTDPRARRGRQQGRAVQMGR